DCGNTHTDQKTARAHPQNHRRLVQPGTNTAWTRPASQSAGQAGTDTMNPEPDLIVESPFDSEPQRYVLHLYVTGMTPRSTEAITNIKIICEEHLAGAYELVVIDIYQQPHLASSDQIIATPTLIKKFP